MRGWQGRPGCQLSGRPGQTSSRLPDLNRSPSSPHGAGETCPDASSFLPSLLWALCPAGVRLSDLGWSLPGSPVLPDFCLHDHLTQAHSPLGTGKSSPRVPRPRERVLEGEVAGVSSMAPDQLRGHSRPPPAVSATVTPVAQPCTDPHPEPPPRASWWLKCPSGSYLLLGVEPAASSQRPSGKMAHFLGHSIRPGCSVTRWGWSWARPPGAHTHPRGAWKEGGLSVAGRWPLPTGEDGGARALGNPPSPPPSGLSWTFLLPGASEGPGPRSLEQPADLGFPCRCCQLVLPSSPFCHKEPQTEREITPCLVPIRGSKLNHPFMLLMQPLG